MLGGYPNSFPAFQPPEHKNITLQLQSNFRAIKILKIILKEKFYEENSSYHPKLLH